jgi:hypothetical protein
MRRSRSSGGFTAAVAAATLLLAAHVRRAQAQNAAPGIEGGAFLLLPVGARAVALGQAATADGGTTEAMFWNPAGLAALPASEFAIYHYDAFFGSGDAVAFGVPSSSLGSFGVAAYLVNYGDLAVTRGDLGPIPVGQISPRNLALMATYATDVVGGLAVGITYKLVQFRVDCSGDCSNVPTATGTTHAVDVGLRWAFGAWRPLVVGVSLRNLGFDLQVNNQAQADPLPTRLAVGISAQLVRPAVGAQGLDARLLADVQSPVLEGAFQAVTLVGVETGVGDALRMRFGYAFLNSEARGPSLGVGVRFGSVAFDLARTFSSAQDIGDKPPVQGTFRVIF